MNKKIFLVAMLSICVAGCDSPLSDEKEAPGLRFINVRDNDFEKLSGHWVYNPAKCEGKIKIHGLLEYKFSENGLSVGGAQMPLTGTLISRKISAEVQDLFSNMKTCSGNPVILASEARHLQFESRSYDLAFVVSGEDVWAIEDNGKPYLLERFSDVDFKGSEIIEPTQKELSNI
ncbi:hypothetical protein QL995_17505 [Pseudoalteromonas sp. APC 3358]|uniref:hypothetical protein n=1 Tax=Pseudoalteromonas sp. APC 3358 TaxID=3035176 RepID=UPI0025B598CC|nr:hypothetical protein [Pseudoalteromonas sp. APC 3358]MDN3384433.1 hypothetical protein [Pseudoalteromonas sp. APC 3358]